MSLPNELLPVGLLATGAVGGYEIERSLRFNSADSAYLSRTPASAGNRKTWTWAGWVKRSNLSASARHALFASADAPGTSYIALEFYNNTLRFIDSSVGGTTEARITSAVYRDTSAWMHIVCIYDTTQATAANRIRLYTNGSEITQFSSTLNPSQNSDGYFNQALPHSLGSSNTGGTPILFFPGYLADIHFIDGQALDPTSFGEFDRNGIWQPVEYTGEYGTNGFHLPFSDNSSASALGTDTSGNENDWTVNNLSVTAGAGNDSLIDVPTNGTEEDTGLGGEVRGNYCTWNPLNTASTLILTNGNLNTQGFSGDSFVFGYGTIGVSSGKWYYEATPTSVYLQPYYIIGFGRGNKLADIGSDEYLWYSTGALRGASSSSYGSSWTANDVIGIALDLDAGTLVFYKNGVSQGTAFTGITGTVFPKFGYWHGTGFFNFGQRPFAYQAPEGFKALNTANLPTPTILDGSDYMDVVTYTGNGSTQTITTGFSPDLVWVKQRDSTNPASHVVVDAVRGNNLVLRTNGTDQENSSGIDPSLYDGVTNLSSTGFDAVKGSSTVYNGTNGSGKTYVAWAWDAGSSTVENTDGTITSQVRANPSAGFSIVTYTGTGANATVGHGLGVAPGLIIVKQRSSTQNWVVYHPNTTNANWYLRLNTTDAQIGDATVFRLTPTSTDFAIGTNAQINASTATYVAYCFAPVSSYSSFGSYTGNGSSDGPFVYLGFRPRFLLWKSSSYSTGDTNWVMFDSARSPYNRTVLHLRADLGAAEASGSEYIDLCSNGFKLRYVDANNNANGQTYIYAAFAENPFSVARAR